MQGRLHFLAIQVRILLKIVQNTFHCVKIKPQQEHVESIGYDVGMAEIGTTGQVGKNSAYAGS